MLCCTAGDYREWLCDVYYKNLEERKEFGCFRHKEMMTTKEMAIPTLILNITQCIHGIRYPVAPHKQTYAYAYILI